MVRSAAGGWNEDQTGYKPGTGLSSESCVVRFVFCVFCCRPSAGPSQMGGDDSPVNANGTYPSLARVLQRVDPSHDDKVCRHGLV